MSDQAQVQSPELSIEDRMAILVDPETPEELEGEEVEAEEAEAAPQDNEEDAEESEDEELSEEDEQAEDDEETEELDLVEIEVDGETYQIPEQLKDKFMLQADYTRKTQEVAEQRRQVEEATKQLQQQAQFQQAHMDEIIALKSIDSTLAQYQNIDWNALYDADPVEAMKLDRQLNALKEQRAQSVQKIQHGEQYRTFNQQQETAKLVEQSATALASEIKDWSPSRASEVGNYIRSYEKLGISDDDMKALNDGRYGAVPIIWAYKASQYDKMMADKSVTKHKVKNLPKVAKPQGGSKPSPNKVAQDNARKQLKKTGSIDDAANAFLSRM